MSSVLDLLGRFHPVAVHLPIGIFLLLACIELAGLLPHGPRLTATQRTFILAVGLIFAAATAFFGWLLARDGGYNAALLQRHQWLGFSFAALAAVLLIAHVRGWRRLYGVLLSASVVVLGAAGHFGGTLTHGENYLTAPMAGERGPIKPAEALVFADVIHPILEQRCTACHGATKSNGDLRYDTLEELLKGGKSGPAFKPGEAVASRMIKRVYLPLDAKEHMPPKGKTQLTEDEIALLEWWIDAGAPTRQRVAEVNPPAALAEVIATRLGVPPVPPPDRAEMLAVAATLEQKLGIVVRPLTIDEPWFEANARLRQKNFGDAQLTELAPIAAALRWLDLGETAVTDAGLRALAPMSELRRLHLDRTAVTDAGLAQLAPLIRLEAINLHATNVTDAGLVTLRALPRLRSLYLWQTDVTPEAVAKLAEHQTDQRKIARWKSEIASLEASIRAEHFTANMGASPPADATSAAGQITAAVIKTPLQLPKIPAAVANAAENGRSLTIEDKNGRIDATVPAEPVNARCPVSGEAVNESVTELVDGRSIAFCCESCREEFKAEPAKFPLGAK
jgi:uncharacterized membrane protein/mono/diheme cytochrome c family protein